MGPGGPLGLQIQCRVFVTAVVGSIPTPFRQLLYRLERKEVAQLTDKEIKRLTHMSSKAG